MNVTIAQINPTRSQTCSYPKASYLTPNSLIIDANQKLEWLALKVTQGMTPNQAVAVFSLDGFRLANLDEVTKLLATFNLPMFGAARFEDLRNYQNQLGTTFSFPGGIVAGGRFKESQSQSAKEMFLDIYTNTVDGGFVEMELVKGREDKPSEFHGVFLVRNSQLNNNF